MAPQSPQKSTPKPTRSTADPVQSVFGTQTSNLLDAPIGESVDIPALSPITLPVNSAVKEKDTRTNSVVLGESTVKKASESSVRPLAAIPDDATSSPTTHEESVKNFMRELSVSGDEVGETFNEAVREEVTQKKRVASLPISPKHEVISDNFNEAARQTLHPSTKPVLGLSVPTKPVGERSAKAERDEAIGFTTHHKSPERTTATYRASEYNPPELYPPKKFQPRPASPTDDEYVAMKTFTHEIWESIPEREKHNELEHNPTAFIINQEKAWERFTSQLRAPTQQAKERSREDRTLWEADIEGLNEEEMKKLIKDKEEEYVNAQLEKFREEEREEFAKGKQLVMGGSEEVKKTIVAEPFEDEDDFWAESPEGSEGASFSVDDDDEDDSNAEERIGEDIVEPEEGGEKKAVQKANEES